MHGHSNIKIKKCYIFKGFANIQIRKKQNIESMKREVEEKNPEGGLYYQNAGRNVYKEVAIMWKNKESYVD